MRASAEENESKVLPDDTREAGSMAFHDTSVEDVPSKMHCFAKEHRHLIPIHRGGIPGGLTEMSLQRVFRKWKSITFGGFYGVS